MRGLRRRQPRTGVPRLRLPSGARAGFTFRVPDGAYYVLCQTGALDPAQDSSAYARRIVTDPGIAAVPGTSLYADPAQGAGLIRFAFPKRIDTLKAAAERIEALRV